MTVHGITTSRAMFWVHLHPLEAKIYRFVVADMLTHIRRTNPRLIAAKPHGVETGWGYLVAKRSEFIQCKNVPTAYLSGIDWSELTDREKGLFYGEDVVLRLCNDKIIFPTARRPFYFANDRQRQWDGIDVDNGQITIDVKTETYRSNNLFVQQAEHNHNVHVTRSGARRVVEVPELLEVKPEQQKR